MEQGHGIALGNHLIGNFSETPCAECGEPSSHFWRDATFNSAGWGMCDQHAMEALVQTAEDAGGTDALLAFLIAKGGVELRAMLA